MRTLNMGVACMVCSVLLSTALVGIGGETAGWEVQTPMTVKGRPPVRLCAKFPRNYRSPESKTVVGQVAVVVRNALILAHKGDGKGLAALYGDEHAWATGGFVDKWKLSLVNWVVEFKQIGLNSDGTAAFVHVKPSIALTREAYDSPFNEVIFLERGDAGWMLTPEVLDSEVVSRVKSGPRRPARPKHPPVSPDPFK